MSFSPVAVCSADSTKDRRLEARYQLLMRGWEGYLFIFFYLFRRVPILSLSEEDEPGWLWSFSFNYSHSKANYKHRQHLHTLQERPLTSCSEPQLQVNATTEWEQKTRRPLCGGNIWLVRMKDTGVVGNVLIERLHPLGAMNIYAIFHGKQSLGKYLILI